MPSDTQTGSTSGLGQRFVHHLSERWSGTIMSGNDGRVALTFRGDAPGGAPVADDNGRCPRYDRVNECLARVRCAATRRFLRERPGVLDA
jgi:hypothetical protein